MVQWVAKTNGPCCIHHSICGFFQQRKLVLDSFLVHFFSTQNFPLWKNVCGSAPHVNKKKTVCLPLPTPTTITAFFWFEHVLFMFWLTQYFSSNATKNIVGAVSRSRRPVRGLLLRANMLLYPGWNFFILRNYPPTRHLDRDIAPWRFSVEFELVYLKISCQPKQKNVFRP